MSNRDNAYTSSILSFFLQQNLIIGMYFYLFGITSRKKIALINLFFNIAGRQA